jgi:hypothetical protein
MNARALMRPVRVPHVRIVLAVCAVAILGYAAFSVWAVFYSQDATLVGDVIGTWKSFAVAAFTFWLGSSSGGKARDEHNPPDLPDLPVKYPEPTYGDDR